MDFFSKIPVHGDVYAYPRVNVNENLSVNVSVNGHYPMGAHAVYLGQYLHAMSDLVVLRWQIRNWAVLQYNSFLSREF